MGKHTGSLIHIVNTHKKEEFQILLKNTSYSLPEAYGLFWLLLEEIITDKTRHILFDSLTEELKLFTIKAIETDLIKVDVDGNVYSPFILRSDELRLEKGRKNKEITETFQKEISELKKENERLKKVLKLRIKK